MHFCQEEGQAIKDAATFPELNSLVLFYFFFLPSTRSLKSDGHLIFVNKKVKDQVIVH